jgi:hypothetical protein
LKALMMTMRKKIPKPFRWPRYELMRATYKLPGTLRIEIVIPNKPRRFLAPYLYWSAMLTQCRRPASLSCVHRVGMKGVTVDVSTLRAPTYLRQYVRTFISESNNNCRGRILGLEYSLPILVKVLACQLKIHDCSYHNRSSPLPNICRIRYALI